MTTATFDDTLARSQTRKAENDHGTRVEYVRCLLKGEALSDDEADRMFVLATELLEKTPDQIQRDRAIATEWRLIPQLIEEAKATKPDVDKAQRKSEKAHKAFQDFASTMHQKRARLLADATMAQFEYDQLNKTYQQFEQHERQQAAIRGKHPELVAALEEV